MLILDATVIVAVLDRRRQAHAPARALLQSGRMLAISTQTVRECLAVATRPVSANGLGIAYDDAWMSVQEILMNCARLLLEDNSWWSAYAELSMLIKPIGRTIYDLGQVAHTVCAGPTASLVSDDAGLLDRYRHLIRAQTLAAL